MSVAERAQVGGVVAGGSLWAESVDVVHVGGGCFAVGLAAQWVAGEVAASGASPLGVVAAGVCTAAALFGCTLVVVTAPAVGDVGAATHRADSLACHACPALPCLTKPCPAGPGPATPCRVDGSRSVVSDAGQRLSDP